MIAQRASSLGMSPGVRLGSYVTRRIFVPRDLEPTTPKSVADELAPKSRSISLPEKGRSARAGGTGLVLAVLSLLIAAGCREVGPEEVLQPVGSVVLQEPSDQPLGRPVHLAVDSAERVYVTDSQEPRVLVFDDEGALLGRVGSPGSGPGEIESARFAVPLPGDHVGVGAIMDDRPGLHVYDFRSGTHLRTVPMDRVPTSVVRSGSTLYLGSIDYGDETSVLRLEHPTGEISAFGPVPSEYVPGGPRAGIFRRAFPVPVDDDRFVVGFGALGEFILVDRDTGESSRLELPAPRRRGIPEDFDARIEDAVGRSYGEVFAQGSTLTYAAPADGGRVAVVHQDLGTGMPPLPDAAYLGVIDLQAERVCVDVPIPIDRNAPPVYAWHDGRFAVLQQRLGEGLEAPPVLRWYDVQLHRCRWTRI